MNTNRLWCFGDSFTAGDGCICSPKENPYSEITKQYRAFLHKQDGEEILIYPEYVSNHFGLELLNTASGGASNEMILDSIFSNVHNIQKNDYIIIGFSYFQRFDVYIDNRFQPTNVNSISTTSDEQYINNHLTKQGLLEIINNRNNNAFKERWIRQIKGLKYLLNGVCDNVCIWTHCDDFWDIANDLFLIPEPYTQFTKFMGDYNMAIMQETNGMIADGHFGANAHKLWADIIIKHFENE